MVAPDAVVDGVEGGDVGIELREVHARVPEPMKHPVQGREATEPTGEAKSGFMNNMRRVTFLRCSCFMLASDSEHRTSNLEPQTLSRTPNSDPR